MAKEATTTRVVMVSSTARDLPRHREQVMSACLQQNMLPKMMEHLPASDANAIQASLRMVDEADMYIGVIGFRYGYVPKGHKISITEMEYERAGKREIPRLMFLMNEDHALRAADVETGAGAAKLQAFRHCISDERVIATFSSPEDLRADVVQALSEFRLRPVREDLVSSQINATTYRVAVINQCQSVGADEVEAVVAALQTQVHRDLASTWGIDAQLTLVRAGETPPEKAWWFFLQDDLERVEMLGYHDVNAAGLPMARIGVRKSKELGGIWSVTASHVLLELLANPKGNLTVIEGDRFIPQEICNPCSGEKWAYEIGSAPVSDFVLPAWFDTFLAPGSALFDHCGHIQAPYQVLPGSYVTFFDTAHNTGWRTVVARTRPLIAIRAARRRKRGDGAKA